MIRKKECFPLFKDGKKLVSYVPSVSSVTARWYKSS